MKKEQKKIKKESDAYKNHHEEEATSQSRLFVAGCKKKCSIVEKHHQLTNSAARGAYKRWDAKWWRRHEKK